MIPTWFRRESIPTILHGVSLAVAALVLLQAMRGQWFFYDEWDFLGGDRLWQLLAPHNGHLSLLPAFITAVLYTVAGLHAYWPFLAVTVLLHLAIAHLLWRVMRRVGVHPYVAVALALLFAVIAAGSENILWAFQTGFILPVFFGLIAYLIVDSERPWGHREQVAVAVLSLLALASASTALPVVFALLLLLLVRRGWRPALLTGIVAGVPYLLWYVLFNLGPSQATAFRASSLSDFVSGVPIFVGSGVLGTLAKTLPLPQLAPAVLVVWFCWTLFDLGRGRPSGTRISGAYFLALAGLVFGLLTAVTRLQLGAEEASTSRYAYFYVAMLLPAFGLFVTWLVGRTAVAASVACLLLLATAGGSAVALLQQSATEAAREQYTREAMSAVVQLAERETLDPDARPIPVIAPQLTVSDILRFSDSGAFDTVAVTPSAELSVELALGLQPAVVGQDAPTDCAPLDADGIARFTAGEERLVYTPVAQNLTVNATRDGGVANAVQIAVQPGLNEVSGLDDLDLALTPQQSDGVCAVR